MNHSELESPLSALKVFPLTNRGREREKEERGRERERDTEGKRYVKRKLWPKREENQCSYSLEKKNTANWTVDSNKRKRLDTHTLQFTFSTHWTAQFPLGALLRISHSHSELKYVFNKMSPSKKIKGYLRVFSFP